MNVIDMAAITHPTVPGGGLARTVERIHINLV